MPDTGDMLEKSGAVEVPVRKSEKRRLFIIASVVAVIALMIGIGFLSTGNSKERKLQKQLDLGQKYIDELEYEQALACYMAAIEIEPMCTEAYIGAAGVYAGMEDLEAAIEILKNGYEVTLDAEIKKLIEEIQEEIDRVTGRTEAQKYSANNLEISNVTYFYEAGSSITYSPKNEGSIGGLNISFDVISGLDDLCEPRILRWVEGEFSEEQLSEAAINAKDWWGIPSKSDLMEYPCKISNSFPVYEEDLGKIYQVLLVSQDSTGIGAAYAIIEVLIPNASE